MCTFIKALFSASFLIASGFTIASDWKQLPGNYVGYYTENKKFSESRAILSDIKTGHGIMDIALKTVNSKCLKKNLSGFEYFYINNTLVKMQYFCTSDGTSIYIGSSQKAKDYIFTEFNKMTEVCFSLKKDTKGMCFSAIGFNDASAKLSDLIIERSNAL